jgi:hypothetical protein
MKIECTIKRKGGTQIPMGNLRYHFKPAGLNVSGPHVATVNDDKHIGMFLAAPEAYRHYAGDGDAEQPEKLNQTVMETATKAPELNGAVELSKAIGIHGALTPEQIGEILGDAAAGRAHKLTQPVKRADPVKQTSDEPPAAQIVKPENDTNTQVPLNKELAKLAVTQTVDNAKAKNTEATTDAHTKDALEGMTDEKLAELYEEKEGRKPPSNIKRETMIDALAE